MKKLMAHFSMALLLAFSFAISAQAESLKVGWEPWEPYQYENSQGKLTGLDIDLIRAILEGSKLNHEFVKRPWKRLLSEVKSGSIHIAPGASKTAEREAYANFSLPYRNEQIVLLVNADKKSAFNGLTNLRDFVAKGHSVGVVREYYYGDEYKEMSKDSTYKGNFKEVSDDNKNIQKLLENRIDAIMIDPVAAGVLIKKNEWQGKFHSPFTVYSDDIFMMFSKQSVSQETIDTINATLDSMKQDGSHQAILNQYLSE